MKRGATLLVAALSATALSGLVPRVAFAEGSDPSWATCSAQTVPVTLSATDPTVYYISGRLCLRSDANRGSKTVEVMLAGLTYDHNYFNISYSPDTY